MVLVEKETTARNIELARSAVEFEKRRETEGKFTPTNPELFMRHFKHLSQPIEQSYLSSPNDEFSLRTRRIDTAEGTFYSATLKDRGEIINGVLTRTEVETEIGAEKYNQYAAMDLPTIRKLRTDLGNGVTIDFYDSAHVPVIVEIEQSDPNALAVLKQWLEETTGDTLVNRSTDPLLTSEAMAYADHAKKGGEMNRPPESLDVFTKRVADDMLAHYATGKNHVIIGLTGMSGSGKTTVTRSLQDYIVQLFGEDYRPIVISTDDYHLGKTHLEAAYGAPYTDWDDPKTYNTPELAAELLRFKSGEAIQHRHFDFKTEEPAFGEPIRHSPFIIVEGLYAGSKDLAGVRDLHFELPTSIATSIGRDVRRLIIENRANRAFPTPESRLRYQLEVALPLYLKQERPARNVFNASLRPLSERTHILDTIRY